MRAFLRFILALFGVKPKDGPVPPPPPKMRPLDGPPPPPPPKV